MMRESNPCTARTSFTKRISRTSRASRNTGLSTGTIAKTVSKIHNKTCNTTQQHRVDTYLLRMAPDTQKIPKGDI